MAAIGSALSRALRPALMAGLMVLALAGVPSAATQPVAELQVKAAFLFNFAKFVTWPEVSRPMTICIAGNAPLAAAVTTVVQGKLVAGRAVDVRPLSAGSAADGCDLLHLADLSPDEASAMLGRIRGPVLTVGETARFLRDGGMVRVYVDDHRMRFQVNRRQTDAAGLKISSQLLSLASQ